ncbi:MAG: EamA family transporter [Gammaproteobacteria bacterium]|nr:EamA family transporter [Gammaproteobacteria bacterium]
MYRSNRTTSAVFAAAFFGIATYAGMDVTMKSLSLTLGVYNAMLWRSMLSAAIAALIYYWRRPRWPKNSTIRLHIWRGIVISIMAFLFFWGLKFLPVAEAIGLSFIAPLIALYLATVILHEKISSRSVIASLIGLCGTIIIVIGRLSGEYDNETGKGIISILLSAVLYAYNLILQRQQALVAEPLEIAFFHNCTVIFVFGCLSPFLAIIPSASHAPQIALASILGLVSLLMMSWAYARAPANILIPVEYTAFVWAVILGWLVFEETVTITTVIGTLLIVLGCLMAAWQKGGSIQHIKSTTA